MSGNRVSPEKARWMVRKYGSRLGLIHTVWHQSLKMLGAYDRYWQVDWDSIERLVFVCKGNICRSAFAEAVAKSIDIDSVSCGLDTIEDAPANTDAIRAARLHGIDLKSHKTKPYMYLVFRKTDLLVAMEPWQINFLSRNLTREHQFTLLGLWADPSLPYIHDPYGSDCNYFDHCFKLIKVSVHELAKKIKTAR